LIQVDEREFYDEEEEIKFQRILENFPPDYSVIHQLEVLNMDHNMLSSITSLGSKDKISNIQTIEISLINNCEDTKAASIIRLNGPSRRLVQDPEIRKIFDKQGVMLGGLLGEKARAFMNFFPLKERSYINAIFYFCRVAGEYDFTHLKIALKLDRICTVLFGELRLYEINLRHIQRPLTREIDFNESMVDISESTSIRHSNKYTARQSIRDSIIHKNPSESIAISKQSSQTNNYTGERKRTIISRSDNNDKIKTPHPLVTSLKKESKTLEQLTSIEAFDDLLIQLFGSNFKDNSGSIPDEELWETEPYCFPIPCFSLINK